jgi:hypothetical protein
MIKRQVSRAAGHALPGNGCQAAGTWAIDVVDGWAMERLRSRSRSRV